MQRSMAIKYSQVMSRQQRRVNFQKLENARLKEQPRDSTC